MNKENKIVQEHYQKHTITEIEHFPAHDKRRETLTFINARAELEDAEHLGCYVCGSMKNREDHHIFERAFWNALDVRKVARFLFDHFDFHGHCKRDFKSADELYKFFMDNFNGRLEEEAVEIYDEHGNVIGTQKVKVHVCDDEAADTIYNQLILCKDHHRGEGTGIHGTTGPTFFAWLARKDGYQISLSPKDKEAA
jgi:hypothetical protein